MRRSASLLAPMHRIAHAQLVLAASREAWVSDVVAASLGEDAVSALATARRRHPLNLPETLDDLAEFGDPHDILDRAVAALLTREAAGHAALLILGGDDAEVRLRLAAFDHGSECGRTLAARKRRSGPSDVFDALADALLEDMPCRPHVALLLEDSRRVAWVHSRCPYRPHWDRARADAAPACQIMSAWVRGLAGGLDPGVEYRRPRSLALGDARCEHELIVIG